MIRKLQVFSELWTVKMKNETGEVFSEWRGGASATAGGAAATAATASETSDLPEALR